MLIEVDRFITKQKALTTFGSRQSQLMPTPTPVGKKEPTKFYDSDTLGPFTIMD